jgi:pimeloyl-ACP methyl ester carboxylesterase
VNGLSLAGLSWGNPGGRPLLALHGWLDNAASFSVMAPLLEQHHVVAVDLTGHGLSANRSADAGYQIWDDLPELLGILEALGWDRFSLLGHSRGAIISSLLASAIPERVERLVLLDGVVPAPVGEDQFPLQMRRFLDDKRRWLHSHNRVYPSVEAALASRKRSSLPATAARALVERNLRPCEGGYSWTTDLRLRGASAVKLTEGQIEAVLGALSMPTLLLLAQEGYGGQPELARQASRYIRQLDIVQVSGGHHFHMEPGAAIVAQRINGFLQA